MLSHKVRQDWQKKKPVRLRSFSSSLPFGAFFRERGLPLIGNHSKTVYCFIAEDSFLLKTREIFGGNLSQI